MSDAKKIKVAIIGFGLSGSTFHAPFLIHSSQFSLVAVVSSKKAHLAALLPTVPVFADIEELLNSQMSVDLVIVTTPNHTHYEISKIALQNDKHVVVEKPFVLKPAQAQELLALAKQKNLILCSYQNRRWDGPIVALKKLIMAGIFGDIYQCDLHFDRYRPQVKKTKWKELNSVDGAGSLYDLGPHLIDHALAFFGWPEYLQADITKQRPDADVDDYFHLNLSYGKTRVILHSSSVILGDVPSIQVHGDKASFICYGLDEQEENLSHFWQQPAGNLSAIVDQPAKNKAILRTYENSVITDATVEIATGNYQNYYEAIYKAIQGIAPPPISAEDMLNNVRLIDLAYLSNKSGQRIKLD